MLSELEQFDDALCDRERLRERNFGCNRAGIEAELRDHSLFLEDALLARIDQYLRRRRKDWRRLQEPDQHEHRDDGRRSEHDLPAP
jgi:hypothetical protein